MPIGSYKVLMEDPHLLSLPGPVRYHLTTTPHRPALNNISLFMIKNLMYSSFVSKHAILLINHESWALHPVNLRSIAIFDLIFLAWSQNNHLNAIGLSCINLIIDISFHPSATGSVMFCYINYFHRFIFLKNDEITRLSAVAERYNGLLFSFDNYEEQATYDDPK